MKRKMIFAIGILLLLYAMTVNAFAAQPDMSQKGSISITMTYQDKTVTGGSLTLYRVAEVRQENGADYSYTYTSEYAECQISLGDLKGSGLASALAEYTAEKKITGTKLDIDAPGKIIFKDLELGLYLLVQDDPANGYEKVSPFLVSVPALEDENYIYDVDASPKLALKVDTTTTVPPVKDEPPSADNPPSKIPQTGLNRWPIPVLTIGGLIMIVLGLVFYISGKKRDHES